MSDSFTTDSGIGFDQSFSTNQSKKNIDKSGSNRAMHLFALNSINCERYCFDNKNWAYNCSQTSEKNKGEDTDIECDTITSSIKSTPVSDNFIQMPLSVNPFALVPPNVEEYECYTKGYNKELPDQDNIHQSTIVRDNGSN